MRNHLSLQPPAPLLRVRVSSTQVQQPRAHREASAPALLTYIAWVHREGRHVLYIDPLDIFDEQPEQRQVERGYPCLVTLKKEGHGECVPWL